MTPDHGGLVLNPTRIAMASGISCFCHGYEFALGPELQECVAPVLVARKRSPAARIVELTEWTESARVEGSD